MFNRYKQYLALGFFVLIAACIRLSNLGTVPHGITWDEAAIGYNGYALITTRRDEWLQKLPVSFKSFGDYKAPLAIYYNGPFTYFLGMTPFAVRLPFAFAGIVTIIAIFSLCQLLLRQEKYSFWYSLLAAAVVATNPWHTHFSRIAFESGLSLLLLLLGSICFIEAFKYRSQSIKINTTITTISAVLAGIFFSGSVYAYHSAKIVTPLLFIIFSIAYFSDVKKNLRLYAVIICSLLFCSYPLIKDSIWGNGLERAGVTVFSQQPLKTAILTTGYQFLQHLSPAFLFNGYTGDLRHGDGKWGVFFITDVVLIFLALVYVVYFGLKKLVSPSQKRLVFIAVSWVCAGILPAAISQDAPHANRALLALPGFVILIMLGFMGVIRYCQSLKGTVGKKKQLSFIVPKLGIGVYILIQSFLSLSYVEHYNNVYAKESTAAFSDGYIEAFTIAKEYEKGENGKKQVDKILFTNEYGQPYIYALFVRRTNPIWYQGGSLVKYEFTDNISSFDLARDNTLIVVGPHSDIDKTQATHIIKGVDGSTRFELYLTNDY